MITADTKLNHEDHTTRLIMALSEHAVPVRRLPHPGVQAMLWSVGAMLFVAALIAVVGMREDLSIRMENPTFLPLVLGLLLTGMGGALAAFMLSRPDRSLWWSALALPGLALWFGSVGLGCARDWAAMGADALPGGISWTCIGSISLGSLPLGLTLAVLLRHAGAVRPTATVLMAAMAATGFAALALTGFHEVDAAFGILLWQTGTAVLVMGLGATLAKPILMLGTRLAMLR